ncbi:MAG: MATE family efflux transporter [Lachnospiraceae bacterium]|nr:MATE family efflux transporter [Lachnospiraceae bacterium]
MILNTTAKKQKSVGLDLTEGSVLRLLLVFAVPIMLTNLIQQLYSMVDLMVVGQYVGSVGTVGVSTGGELSDIMTPIATAFATAGQIYIAQLVGAKDTKAAKETIGTLITLMMLVSLVCMFGCIIFCNQILSLLNCPEEAFSAARQYMIITAIGMPFIFGYNAICGVLRGMGESKRPMTFIIVAAVVNIVLDLVLVVFFRMDVAGTAIATMLAQFGSFAAAFYFMYRNKEQFDFELKLSYFKMNKKSLLIILRLGIPQFVRVTCVRFSMLWVNAQINSFGLTVSATNSIGNKLNKFLEVFLQGVDSASGAMIGQNLGAKKVKRSSQIVWTTLGCTLVIAAVLMSVVLIFPTQLFRIFTTDTEVIQFGITYLRILAVSILISAIIGPFNSVVTGCGFVELGFVIGILDGVICRIGLSLVYTNVFGLGATGYFWGNATCRILPLCVCLIYYFSGKWKTRKLLAE